MRQNDFAGEYKEMIRADVPDLWARIEAKIDERESTGNAEVKTDEKESTGNAGAKIDERESIGNADRKIDERESAGNAEVKTGERESIGNGEVTAAKNDDAKSDVHREADPAGKTEKGIGGLSAVPEKRTAEVSRAEVPREQAKIRKFRWQPYAGIAAAAALCLMIAIPVMRLSNSGTTMATSTKADAGSEAPYSAEAPAEDSVMAAVAADTTAEEAACETEAPHESANGERGADAEQSVTLGGFPSDHAAYAGGASEMNSTATDEAAGSTNEGSSSATITEEAITPGSEAADDDAGTSSEAEAEQDGTLYYAGTEVSASTIIVSVVPGTSRDSLEKILERYHLSIGYDYSGMNMYALTLDPPVRDEAQLKELLEALKEEKCISDAEPDGIVHID